VGAALGVDPLGFVLTGGDDHALAACFAPGAVPEGWWEIGSVHEAGTDGAGVTVDGEPWLGEQGHRHFA
jgi:thiamine-monophosphate kinase